MQGELKRKGLLKLFPLSRETHLLSETPPSVRERGSLREMVLRRKGFLCVCTGRRLFDISRFGVQVPKLMRMVHEFLEGL